MLMFVPVSRLGVVELVEGVEDRVQLVRLNIETKLREACSHALLGDHRAVI